MIDDYEFDEMVNISKRTLIDVAIAAIEIKNVRVAIRVNGYEKAFIPYEIKSVHGLVTLNDINQTLYTTLDQIQGVLVSKDA